MPKRGFARRPCPPWIVSFLFVGLAAASSPEGLWSRPARAKVETWRQEGPAAFAKCHRESVVISDNGRVRLGHSVAAPSGPACMRRGSGTWRGRVTGPCWRRPVIPDRSFDAMPSPTLRGPCSTTAADSQVLSPWSTGRTGRSSPARVRTARSSISPDPEAPVRSPFDAKVQYIWDMAADPQGNVYAATGPTGQLWKRSREGRWSVLYDSKSTHLLCVAVGPDGSVYAVVVTARG